MTKFDRLADAKLAGSSLRNQAAQHLGAIYENVRLEQMILGKKVDVTCDTTEFGKRSRLFVEVKDYKGNLSRASVAQVIGDYAPLVDSYPSSRLLIVTRAGLSS